MTDLPTKDEIVERVCEAAWPGERRHDDSEIMGDALDALTVPDLMRLLKERGFRVEKVGNQGWVVLKDKPYA